MSTVTVHTGAPRQRLDALARTLADVTPVDLVFAVPEGARWWRRDAALARLGAWHRDLATRVGDRRAAAAYLAAWTAQGPLMTVALPVLLADALPEFDPADAWLRRHPDGWFEGHALVPTGATGAEEIGRPALFDRAAATLVAMTTPIAEAVDAAMPAGQAAVWGALADGIGGRTLAATRHLGTDQVAAWAAVERLLDRLEVHAGRLRNRPALLPVAWNGGIDHFCQRGICCLYYRTVASAARDGEGYCTTCPLRTAESRDRRLVATLEQAAGDRAASPRA